MIKCLNFSELEELAESLRAWEGAQLQSISGAEGILALRLYLRGQSCWLWIDLKPPVAILTERIPRLVKRKKPFHLFVEAHLVGQTLSEVRCDWQEGRVLHLFWGEDKEREIELRLFPQAKNIIVRSSEKSLSALKVKPLLPVQEPPANRTTRSAEELRDELLSPPSSGEKSSSQSSVSSAIKKWQREKKKKIKAREELQKKVDENLEERWQEAGEWLKSSGAASLKDVVTAGWSDFLDDSQSFAWNLENCFAQAKKNRLKKTGRLAQLSTLTKEIAELEEKLADPAKAASEVIKSTAKGSPDLMRKAGVRGRRWQVDEHTRVSLGKSGKDNLALLRAAKPWYLWLHLRDFPGSHAIVETVKGKEVPAKVLQVVSQWLIAESLGSRAAEGEAYEVIWAECRHVKPIKGDRLGRVRFQNEQSMTLVFQSQSSRR